MNRGIAILGIAAALGAVLSLRVAVTLYSGSAQTAAGSMALVLTAVSAGLFAGAIIAGRSKGKFLPFRIARVWIGSLRQWAEHKERELRDD